MQLHKGNKLEYKNRKEGDQMIVTCRLMMSKRINKIISNNERTHDNSLAQELIQILIPFIYSKQQVWS